MSLKYIKYLRDYHIKKYREIPNIIEMNNTTFQILANTNRVLYTTVVPKIFGMEIHIDNNLPMNTFKFRRDKMNDDYLDAVRYAMNDINNTNNLLKKINNKLPKKYVINNGAVILFWEDGTKTIVKRAEDDSFDPVKGFLWAYFLKHSGMSRTKANKYLREIDECYKEVINDK